MSRFAIRNPYFIIVLCLFVVVIGLTSLVRMPVDLFPAINIPEVVVATFYSGMPPEEMEGSITGRFERFFTLGAGIDHMESRLSKGSASSRFTFSPEPAPTPMPPKSRTWPWLTWDACPKARCRRW